MIVTIAGLYSSTGWDGGSLRKTNDGADSLEGCAILTALSLVEVAAL